jgi:hypothetical protein
MEIYPREEEISARPAGEANERKREGKSFHLLPRMEPFQRVAATPKKKIL